MLNTNNNNRRYQNNNKEIDGNVKWTAANKYYELIQELQLNMLDARKTNNAYFMLDLLDELYLNVYPFIEKFLDDKNVKHFEDYKEIEELLTKIKNPMTDVIELTNNNIIRQSVKLINIRRKVLYKLMAKAELTLPIEQKKAYRPIALSQDGFI